MPPALEVRGLHKSYGEIGALRGVDVAVEAGTVVGLLGPNGAGKTTLVEIVEGLRVPDRGEVRAFGLDPRRSPAEVKERIGVQLQDTSLPETLTTREVLRLFASFYGGHRPVEEVLRLVGLEEKADERTANLSGGQEQRLALGMALIHRPDLLILDEPTAGLDPAARHRFHDLVRELSGAGRTILLTTHYTDEAEALCDRVLMLRAGKIVADGSPFDLVGRAAGTSRIWVAVDGELDPDRLAGEGVAYDGRRGAYHRFTSQHPAATISDLARVLRGDDLSLTDLRVKRPTLEDVYLEIMGEVEAPPVSESSVPGTAPPPAPRGESP